MKKLAAALALLCAVCLSGCNLENEESSHVYTQQQSETPPEQSEPATLQTTTADTTATTSLSTSDVIPEAIQTPRVDGNRLSYTIMNVYSEGEYYTVEISGVKYDGGSGTDIDTTYIKGELYGDFRLDLLKKGEIIDSYKINVPRDDRFLILESVVDSLSYGCELISNKREFGADEYPDLIQLDFHIQNETEAPQYARYFSVFGAKVCEVPVLENGKESAPYGTHPKMKSAGLMTQNITAETTGGNYTVIKYEYTFDIEARCLNKKKVKFTGWED
ncbi:MAG: hypothetical protein KIG62_05490 [Oscillospiraceae bacterium]|nr:hypothetical protein [Oscillospiraceae bacterium]